MKKVLFALLSVAALTQVTVAEARGGFSSSRSSSFSRPSAPRPATKVTNVRNVTVNRTTVVHQSTPSGGGGGMGFGGGVMSAAVGSFAGSSLANMWNNSSNKEEAEKQRLEEEQKQRDEQAALNELKMNMILQQQSKQPVQLPQ